MSGGELPTEIPDDMAEVLSKFAAEAFFMLAHEKWPGGTFTEEQRDQVHPLVDKVCGLAAHKWGEMSLRSGHPERILMTRAVAFSLHDSMLETMNETGEERMNSLIREYRASRVLTVAIERLEGERSKHWQQN
jgi:hypothetical protein